MSDADKKVARSAQRETSDPGKYWNRRIILNARFLVGVEVGRGRILLAIEDITGWRVPKKEGA